MLAVCYGPVAPIARTELLDGCYDLFHVKCRNSLELQLSVIIDLIVQRRALHIIGAGTWLPSLTHRRLVAACTFLYKLFFLPPLSPLRSLLPPKAPVPSQPTRLATSSIQGHSHQLETGLPIRSNSSSLRAFPACVVPIWNALPKSLLKDAPTAKKMQSFKVGVHKHLLRQNWFGQTDSL